MSTETTFQITPIRFIRQTTTGNLRDKTNYVAIMSELESLLKDSQWTRASVAMSTVGMPKHDFSGGPYIGETYDAYKMAGKYNTTTWQYIGYAGCVAYRIKVPTTYKVNYNSDTCAVKTITIPVYRDRFLRTGVRIHLVATDTSTPSTDWDVIHGEGVDDATGDTSLYLAEGLLSQASVKYLTSALPAWTNVEVDVSSYAQEIAEATYVWVYLTLENYKDYWTKYSADEDRLYAIEGAANLGVASWTFTDQNGLVTPDGSENDFYICAEGILTPHRAGDMLCTRQLFVQQNGAPIVDSDGTQFPVCTISNGLQASVGLNRAYYEFYAGSGDFFVAEQFDGVHGARFAVQRTTVSRPTTSIYDEENFPVFKIDTAVLVVPFVVPTGYSPGGIQITPTEARNLPDGAKFNVFYSDEYRYALDKDLLKNQALYDLSSDIEGLTFIGSITGSLSTSVPISVRFTQALKSSYGSIVISAYFDPGSFDLSSTDEQGTGSVEFKPTIKLVE